ncbi:MAG: C25 family cysteine peptidase, partial [Planctomycetia bacterium]
MYRSLFMKCNGLRKPPVLRHRSLVCEPLEERTLLSVGTELQLLPITSVSGIETIWFQEATAAARENFHNGVSSLELIDNDASGISGHLTVPGLDYETIPTEISDFTRLDIPGWSTTYEVGQPELPVFRTTLTIPAGVDVVTDVTPLESISLTTADPVYPTQPDTPDMVGWEDTEEASIFWYDTDYYSGVGDSSASDLYWISDTITAGDNHSIAIEFYPFQYDAATGEVSVVTGFDFNIEFVESPEIEMVTVADTDFVSAAGDADYLIITADAYYDEILPLAEWKEIKGYNTYVATMSEVGTTEQDVYNYIKAAYDADSDRPDFVLLVGDHEDVPACEIVGHPYYDSSYLWYTDYDYMLLEGSDNVADLALGRLSGDTETQITTMVNKILTYECTPDATDRYSEILLAGQFQDNNDGVSDNVADRFFMEDLHRIADFLGGDYDFWDDPDPYDKGFTVHTKRVWDSSTSNTLYYRASSYPGRITPPSPVPAAWKTKTDVSSIATTINNGVGIVLHRDHGSANGWGSPSFSTASVNNLTNGDELPVVFSLNCSTGRFADVDAFGEAWLRNANGGAVTMTGAACVSYSGPNDSMHVGIFDSMWNDYDTTWQSSNFSNSWRFGEVMNYAKDRVFSGYGYSSSSALLAARLFNVLGDPELQIRTETPATMDVSYPESIIRGNSTDFTVYVTQNGSPVSDAMVAITHGEERWVGTTGANGELTFYNMTTDDIGLYDVVVTEQNSFPFQGTTESFPTNGVDLLGSQFDVVPDKLLPAGGMATADFSIQNLGDMAAAGFNVRFYMSDDATIDPATDMVLALNASDPAYNPSDPGVYRVTGLDTLATHSASVALVVPADDPFDTDSEYFIGMIVDADGEITENIEDNNANRGQDVDRDDVDYLPGPVDHFVWELDSLFKYVDVPFSVNITAIDSDGFVVTNYDGPAELTALVGGNEDIYFNDFESDDGGWVASATWDPVGNWEWGTPTSGPDEAFSGQNVWATVL